MSERQARSVVNVSAAEGGERRFGARYRPLAEVAGGRGLGSSWYEIAPGRAAYPCHDHCGNEEAPFVLEGEGTLRIGGESVALRAGD